jgi:putative transposase
MGQSLVNIFVHIIFSTKNREQFISPAIENELFAFLGNECQKLDCKPIKIGGHYDHVHILCRMSKQVSIVALLKAIKAHSSIWIKTKGDLLDSFYWQDGYGAFSVSETDLDKVSAYIENQHEHHSKHTFQEEYRAILKRYNVDYDERYVWD